jgi:hypothetical protein
MYGSETDSEKQINDDWKEHICYFSCVSSYTDWGNERCDDIRSQLRVRKLGKQIDTQICDFCGISSYTDWGNERCDDIRSQLRVRKLDKQIDGR